METTISTNRHKIFISKVLHRIFSDSGDVQAGETEFCGWSGTAEAAYSYVDGPELRIKWEIPLILEQGGGAIVFTSSYAGVIGIKGNPAYTAAKHGVIGLTRSAALDYAAEKLRINAVCPGYIDAPMMGRFTGGSAEGRAKLIAEEPVRRMGKPELIAAAVVWLCSDAAAFVVGKLWPGKASRPKSRLAEAIGRDDPRSRPVSHRQADAVQNPCLTDRTRRSSLEGEKQCKSASSDRATWKSRPWVSAAWA